MSVLVKMPHTNVRIDGDDENKVVELLLANFKGSRVEEESSPIEAWNWFNGIKDGITIPEYLRAHRKKHEMTQKDLGDRIGKSKQYISDLENNHRSVTKDIAMKLGEVFQVDYRRFL